MSRAYRSALRIYRLALRLLPGAFAEDNRDEMERLFREVWEGGRGPLGRGWVVLRATWDVVVIARGLRRRENHTRAGGTGMAMRLDGAVHNLRQSMRSLARARGFTALAVLTLGVAIGANVTIFSVVNGVLLEPLPYSNADRIGIIWHDLGNGAQSLPALNQLDYYDYQAWNQTFEEFTIATTRERILGGLENPELVEVGRVAASFMPFFGVEPVLGRLIREDEDVAGGPAVGMLSHGLWERRFGTDPSVIGTIVDVDGRPTEVIGVLPADFELFLPAEAFRMENADVWVPAQIDRGRAPPRNYTGYTVFGRVRPGVTWSEAQADMERMEARLKAEHAVHENSNLQVRVVPLHFDVVKGAQKGLWVLFAAVGLVLMIACANVANLMLVRGRARARELSVRQALGARQTQIARLILTESLLIAVAGGVVGLVLANGGLGLLARLGAGSVPRLESVALDGSVLLFMFAMVAVTAVVFGMIPALQVSKRSPATVMNEEGRGGNRGGARIRRGLIMAEVALSVVLLVGAVLMTRSFAALQEVRPGFNPQDRIAVRVSLPAREFAEFQSRLTFWQQLEERLRALPGVLSVAATSQLPLSGSGPLQPFAYDEATAQNWESVTAEQRSISPGYLQTMGITLLSGRDFTPEDTNRLLNRTPEDTSERVGRIIIDESLAEMAFGDTDPIGQRLQLEAEPAEWSEVIGVVAHVHMHDLTKRLLPEIFYPFFPGGRINVVLETSGWSESLVEQVRSEIRLLSAGIPIEDVRSLEAMVSGAMAQARLSLVLMTVFGVIALLLSAGGLYGVISYTVSMRTREIGICMALGQEPEAVRSGILRDGARLVLPAVVGGLVGSALLGRFLSSLLFGVQPVDPQTYTIVAVLLGGIALLAAWIPARRATRIDPISALRVE